jgi:hypothetical protein
MSYSSNVVTSDVRLINTYCAPAPIFQVRTREAITTMTVA